MIFSVCAFSAGGVNPRGNLGSGSASFVDFAVGGRGDRGTPNFVKIV
jgi:hypothetical protein